MRRGLSYNCSGFVRGILLSRAVLGPLVIVLDIDHLMLFNVNADHDLMPG